MHTLNNCIELIWVPVQTINDDENIIELTSFLSSHSFIQNSFKKLFPLTSLDFESDLLRY